MTSVFRLLFFKKNRRWFTFLDCENKKQALNSMEAWLQAVNRVRVTPGRFLNLRDGEGIGIFPNVPCKFVFGSSLV